MLCVVVCVGGCLFTSLLLLDNREEASERVGKQIDILNFPFHFSDSQRRSWAFTALIFLSVILVADNKQRNFTI